MYIYRRYRVAAGVGEDIGSDSSSRSSSSSSSRSSSSNSNINSRNIDSTRNSDPKGTRELSLDGTGAKRTLSHKTTNRSDASLQYAVQIV